MIQYDKGSGRIILLPPIPAHGSQYPVDTEVVLMYMARNWPCRKPGQGRIYRFSGGVESMVVFIHPMRPMIGQTRSLIAFADRWAVRGRCYSYHRFNLYCSK